MKILLVGGTGLIGTFLKKKLIKEGYTVHILSRRKSEDSQTFLWNSNEEYIDLNAFEGVSGIINLTGANIAESRWTKKRKEILYDSRILSTRLLFKTIKKNKIELDFFINSSGIGYYGTKKSAQIFKENDLSGSDFLAKLCFDWEKEALRFNELNIRTVIIRTGIVLTKYEGALEKMKLPIKFGILPIFGNGKHIFSWIHIDDLISIFINSITNEKFKGPYNAIAPINNTYLEFNNKIAEVLQKKVTTIKIPTFILNLAFGDLAETLTKGNKIAAEKITNEGINFKYKELDSALSNLLKKD
ncbi:MAG: hypothetical protein ACI93P_000797 [bacterium]